ncbi:bifunctional RecB family nuclease/DEAD/DEAH box helicase [Halococcoides cellulosivorans]|nr:ATP-binding protein [Halococcoides cellulosivorans]
MYLYHRYVDEDFAELTDVPLSPLLAATGEKFEESQVRRLLEADVYSVGDSDSVLPFDETWAGNQTTDIDRISGLIEELASGERSRPVVFFQPPLAGTIGSWPVHGAADVVIASSGASRAGASVELRVIEVKSSSAVQTHHQLQAATYALLFECLLEESNIQVSASIVSQDPEYNDLASIVTSTAGLEPSRLSTFDLQTRQNDVQLLLEAGGTVDDILLEDGDMRSSGDPPTYRIDGRCDGCSKQIRCVAHSVRTKQLSLLGLTEGVQQSLAELGVNDLHDLATLYDWPTNTRDRRATSHAHPQPTDPDLVSRITRETDVSNLRNIAQIAHRFLREISPEYNTEWNQSADAGPWGDYLIGTGRNLPDDDPPSGFNLSYPRQSLVRVYPYVQHDIVRNRIVFLAAKVTSTHYEQSHDDGLFVAARPEGHPNDTDAKDEEEQRLIEDFFQKLSVAIQKVRPDLTTDDYDPTEGFIHLYPYGDSQRKWLVEAVKRHTDSEAARSLRTLLGYREAIDQSVVSILQEEFRDRHALRYPGLGIVQTAAQFWGRNSELDWEGPRDSSKTPLKETFAAGFWEIGAEYNILDDRISLGFDDGLQIPDDHMIQSSYPVVGRHQEVLPLEYIYASKEFDLLRPEIADDKEVREQIIRYRHHTDENSPQITFDDIEDGVQAICEAYEHIERCIRDKDATIEKNPLNLRDLSANSLGESELQSTCLEYQNLEYGAQRRQLEQTYRTPLPERVGEGSAIPFEVTVPPVESADEDEQRNSVKGSILRSLTPGRNDGLQPDSQPSLEVGNFVVLTPLVSSQNGRLTEAVDDPVKIKHQVLGVLTALDPAEGTIRVSLNWRYNMSRETFKPNHVGWTTDSDDEYGRQFIDEGMTFVVDTALDDFVGHRAHQALSQAQENDVHNRLVDVYDDEISDALETPAPLFDRKAINKFIEAFDMAMPESANQDQQSFVTRLNHTVAALQGPPGTGKTQYASAPAILSRAYAAGPGFAGIASAHSNTAVDEIADAVGTAQQALSAEGYARDVKMIRVRSGNGSSDLPHNVQDFNYYDDRDELNRLLEQHLEGDGAVPLLVFAAPVTLRNLINSASDVIADAESAEELMQRGQARLFDFALVDEGSMMDLPLLFLLGAFLGRNKQLLLVGDHRQMQPIQKHDWETEDRQTIEENTPSVSALDFVRFLRGEEESAFERLEREAPTWADKQSVLPMDRLQTTYRLPPAMAQFVTDLFYYRDDIDLQSGTSAERMPDVRTSEQPEWLRCALDPEPRVTLLLHDDNVFTKDSPLEAHLLEQLLQPLPVVQANPEDEEITGGIVVPFRLMRRRLQNQFDLTVDTVERFQGAERDVMTLSMTAGNQGYVNQIGEFLLDANRFNVGASRMKQKLFILVSKSLFRAVNSDPRKYEQQKAWKQLYQSLVSGHEPDAEFVVDTSEVDELSTSTKVAVYTGYRD